MSIDDDALSGALALIDGWETPGAAAVFDRSGLIGAHGDITLPHPLASITKLVTSLAVLVAVEEGSIFLDEPAGPAGSTVRHLLCHASGLPFEGARPIAAAGTRRIYSNTGYLALADLLADRTGFEFRDYATEAVLEPLGMQKATFAGGADAGLVASITDLVSLGAELLSPTIIDVSTWRMATEPSMADLPGVLPGWGPYDPCPWGLGPEIRGEKSPHWTGSTAPPTTFGHFGAAGTFLWIDTVNGLGCAVISGQPFGDWALSEWPILSDAVRNAVTGHQR